MDQIQVVSARERRLRDDHGRASEESAAARFLAPLVAFLGRGAARDRYGPFRRRAIPTVEEHF
jgi:hypothetical protein